MTPSDLDRIVRQIQKNFFPESVYRPIRHHPFLKEPYDTFHAVLERKVVDARQEKRWYSLFKSMFFFVKQAPQTYRRVILDVVLTTNRDTSTLSLRKLQVDDEEVRYAILQILEIT